MTIGENIRKIRVERGMTQQKLGKMTGLQQRVISTYERDKNIPGVFNLCSITDALRVSLDELVGRRFP